MSLSDSLMTTGCDKTFCKLTRKKLISNTKISRQETVSMLSSIYLRHREHGRNLSVVFDANLLPASHQNHYEDSIMAARATHN